MNTFFNKFDSNQKFNLMLGDYLNKISGFPDRRDILEAVLSEIKQPIKNYIKNQNSLSEIIQAYLDAVIDTKTNLIKQIKNNYEHRYANNVDIYNDIIKSEYFNNIFSINFDNILETHFSNMLNVFTPLNSNIIKEENINYYKLFGNINSLNDFFFSSQDIRKLKTLKFYDNFFSEVRKCLVENPTILLGIDLDDSDLLDMLEFLLNNIKNNHKTIYIVSHTSIISKKTSEIIAKYDIKIVTSNSKDIAEFLKNNFKKTEGETFEKKIVW